VPRIESAETKVILHVPIEKIEEKFEYANWQRSESGPISTKTSLGWYIQFEGSTESIKLFDEVPPWKVGDKIKITFEKE
jgi:hypothetical protein